MLLSSDVVLIYAATRYFFSYPFEVVAINNEVLSCISCDRFYWYLVLFVIILRAKYLFRFFWNLIAIIFMMDIVCLDFRLHNNVLECYVERTRKIELALFEVIIDIK